VQGAMKPVLNRLPLSDEKVSRREKLERFANGVGLPWRDAHAVWRRIHSDAQKRQVLADEVLNGSGALFATYHQYYDRCQSDTMLDQLLYVDTRFYLPNDMLVKVDRMTMAHGLEARVPFLDHELVELAARCPPGIKLQSDGKHLLKAVARGIVPDAVIDRPKGYFPMPALKYVRGTFLEFMRDILTSRASRERGLFTREYMDMLLSAPEMHHTRIQGSKLWQLALLEFWLQRNVDISP